jgi:hypothetical protein
LRFWYSVGRWLPIALAVGTGFGRSIASVNWLWKQAYFPIPMLAL